MTIIEDSAQYTLLLLGQQSGTFRTVRINGSSSVTACNTTDRAEHKPISELFLCIRDQNLPSLADGKSAVLKQTTAEVMRALGEVITG